MWGHAAQIFHCGNIVKQCLLFNPAALQAYNKGFQRVWSNPHPFYCQLNLRYCKVHSPLKFQNFVRCHIIQVQVMFHNFTSHWFSLFAIKIVYMYCIYM